MDKILIHFSKFHCIYSECPIIGGSTVYTNSSFKPHFISSNARRFHVSMHIIHRIYYYSGRPGGKVVMLSLFAVYTNHRFSDCFSSLFSQRLISITAVSVSWFQVAHTAAILYCF